MSGSKGGAWGPDPVENHNRQYVSFEILVKKPREATGHIGSKQFSRKVHTALCMLSGHHTPRRNFLDKYKLFSLLGSWACTTE